MSTLRPARVPREHSPTMSSLQQQLGSLRAQSSQQFNLRAQRLAHSKSLIFTPQQAASQNFHDIYQQCVQGFNSLCELDGRLRTFGANIFSPDSPDADRLHMTKQDAARTNTAIKDFLSLIAPRIQLEAAQYAIEWLVRRFRYQPLLYAISSSIRQY